MPIHFNNNKIGKIFYNNQKIKKAYLGVNQVFTNKIEHIFICPKMNQSMNMIRYDKKTLKFVSRTVGAIFGRDSISVGDYVISTGTSRDNASVGVLSACDLNGNEVCRYVNQNSMYDSIFYDKSTNLIYLGRVEGSRVEVKKFNGASFEHIKDYSSAISQIEVHNGILFTISKNGENIYASNADTGEFITSSEGYFGKEIISYTIMKDGYISAMLKGYDDVYIWLYRFIGNKFTTIDKIQNTTINSYYTEGIVYGNDNHIYINSNRGMSKYSWDNNKLVHVKSILKYGSESQFTVTKKDDEGYIYTTSHGDVLCKYDYNLDLIGTVKLDTNSSAMAIN